VAAKGKDLDHRRDVREARGLPEYSLDYCFPGNEFGYHLTILVGRERVTGMTMAAVVPEKGSKGKFVADKVLEFITECGNLKGDIVIKTDQEPAIKYLAKDIVLERGNEPGCRTIIEESPVGSSGSNGVVERAVQSVEGQIRALKLALENRIKFKISAKSNVVTFLAEYAAYLLNRLEVGKDGKTATERNRGKSLTVMGVEFGEKVMYKKKAEKMASKIEPRWEKGIFVGVRARSGEFFVATVAGIKKVRSIRRVAVQDRWGEDSVTWVKHVPWNLYKGDEMADGDIPEEQLVEPEALGPVHPELGPVHEGGPATVVKFRKPPPRAFQIRKEDAEKHGYTRGCAGCSSWFRGMARQPHSAECRARFEGLLKDQAKFQNAERRKREFEEKVKEKAAKKARKEQDKDKHDVELDGNDLADEGGEAKKARGEQGMAGSSRDQFIEYPTEGMHLDHDPERVAPSSFTASTAGGQRRPREEADVGARAASGDDEEMDADPDAEWEELARRIKSRRDVLAVSEEYIDPEVALRIEQVMMKEYLGEAGTFQIQAIAKHKKKWDDDAKGYMAKVMQGNAEEEGYAWDDVNMKMLDLRGVRIGRSEEVEYMKSRNIWREVDVDESWAKTGRGPVSVRWVDTDKGTEGVPNIRCRLVARDFKSRDDRDREDLFAATPPLELLKCLLSKAVSGSKCRKILVIDVKKAHLNPECDQDVYIELPPEANPGPGKCGKLVHWLYGFRPAAQAWENHYSSNLEKAGFYKGDASPVLFWHAELDISCVVHGDDFTFVSEAEGLDYIEGLMKKWYEVKVKARLGPEPGDDKEVDILGRRVRWTENGVEYEADPRHRRIILEQLGLEEGSKGLTTNGKADTEELEEEELPGEEATSFRALAARVNYLAQDCPDIQFPAKEVCREMSKPTPASWRKLKALARFLLRRGAVVLKFGWQPDGLPILVFTDSDWAGCRRTRKSTSGGAIMIGGHCIRTWSTTQAPIALSSAEAEYYAMVEGAVKAKGLESMLKELGMFQDEPLTLLSDSSAARAFASRRGLGRMRHMETRMLWLQAEVQQQRIQLDKVLGKENPADLMTKYLSENEIREHLRRLSLFWDRPES
jgi:hypothetical protein